MSMRGYVAKSVLPNQRSALAASAVRGAVSLLAVCICVPDYHWRHSAQPVAGSALGVCHRRCWQHANHHAGRSTRLLPRLTFVRFSGLGGGRRIRARWAAKNARALPLKAAYAGRPLSQLDDATWSVEARPEKQEANIKTRYRAD